MATIMKFREGEQLIGQGDADTAAYLIQSGWLQVRCQKPDGSIDVTTLGPGEVVGELGLAGVVATRTATVTALTDGEVEVIDRGALIRLVNGPGRRLTPLLAALFSRLQTSLLDHDYEVDYEDDTAVMYARIEGMNPKSRQALCNQPCMITHLPWVFGAYAPPQSVTDLFRKRHHVDVKLAGASKLIREDHITIEAAEAGGLQLRLAQHGDFCELDEERVGYGKQDMVVPLPRGRHVLVFGEQVDPYQFSLQVRI
ncbi:MAG: cyclic nucleotide-binding domain-containing protein [Mariprofundaceae bacterium]|nr:cyclic nucleotide-binding domain-containing protein [Mariprofundaceae bacterium]